MKLSIVTLAIMNKNTIAKLDIGLTLSTNSMLGTCSMVCTIAMIRSELC